MGVELIRVVVDGVAYTSWKSVSVRGAVKEAARSFSLTVAAEGGAAATAWKFKAGTKLAIYANGDLLLKGYVDRFQPKLSPTSAEITISGRSKAGDAVDSSALHKTGRFEKKTLLDIAKEIDKQGVGFTSTEALDKIPSFQLNQGETVFRAIERLARSQGLSLMGKPDGGIEITKAGKERHSGGLFEGVNILDGEADHNWSNRHSKYVVRGQRPTGTGADNLEIEATIKDAGVDRNRPVVIIQEDDTDKDRAKKHAKNRRDRAAGNGLKAGVTVQGFRDEGGTIWTPNRLVWVQSPFLNVEQDMLVEGVTYSQDSSGSKTRIELVDPQAYGGKAKGKKGSGKAWKTDDSEPKDGGAEDDEAGDGGEE